MPIIRSGAVSPSALARPMMVPVRMPGSASGTTWWAMVCIFEAPTPSAASRVDVARQQCTDLAHLQLVVRVGAERRGQCLACQRGIVGDHQRVALALAARV